jgi:hypothetical protein
LRSELRLVATDKEFASVETASYFVDKALVDALKAGDVFHITHTGCCGLAISAIRQGTLVFAAGQVSAVPQGSDLTAKIPFDLIDEAEKIFRERDPHFEFAELPIEVCCRGSSRLLHSGHMQIGGYHIWVEHGFRPGLPGEAECVAISLDGACDWVAVSASAQLLSLANS